RFMSLWFVAAHLALPGGFVASTPLHHYDDSIASSSIFGSTALEAKPVLLHELGTQTMSNRVAAFEQAMRQAKFHAPTVSAQDPFRFKHRQQHHDTESDKLTYFEYSARRHGHVLMLNDTDFQRCFLQVSENEITSISLELSTATYSKINITKEDPGESKTHCVDLHSQISNQVYSGLASSSPNSLTFEMPDLGVLQCVKDSLSLLEFQLVVSTIDDCHIKALDFQLLVKEENDSQSFSLNVPAELELGDESKGLRVECKDCYARGTGDVHVLVRTSSGNPFEETWTWGSVSLNAIVDVDIQAYVTSLQSIRSFLVSDRQGIPGLFMNANVAGVGIILGMLAELRVHAEGHFSSPATLPYQSQMGASGTFEHHTRQGLTLQKFLGDFDPTAQQESPAAPQQEIDIDASATVWIIPKMFAGVFTSASASSQAEAYIAFEVQMALSAHFKIRNAPSADGARLDWHSGSATLAVIAVIFCIFSSRHYRSLSSRLNLNLFSRLYHIITYAVPSSVDFFSRLNLNLSSRHYLNLSSRSYCILTLAVSP
ncbi:MAG: hypothetical protein SGPRY_011078, partial [Prymnesium sp.]